VIGRAWAALLGLALSSVVTATAIADELRAVPANTGSSCIATLAVTETLERRQALDFRCPCGCGGNGAAMLIRLLREQFGDAGPPPEVDRLFIGRLEEQLPEVAEGLSLAAAPSSAWDGQRGWSDSGYANGFVRDLLNARRAELYGPLQAVFTAWHIRLEVASIEKVLMAVPADLPHGERLLAAGADPAERVPFDAVVWFRLLREGD
jgi:hypothetical protein